MTTSPRGSDPRGSSGPRLRTGAELAAAANWQLLAGRQLGIFSNPRGVLPDTRHVVDDLVEHGAKIVGLFGPEHGFRGSAQAGSSEGDFTDARTGLPVFDAYGAEPAAMAARFAATGVDTVVWDMQEVGARFYTRNWIMYRAMWAAASLGLSFVVLDRPNPIGGRADGPLLHPDCASDVGLRPIVQQHGLTAGELARFCAGEFLPTDAGRELNLDVVRMTGWEPSRTMDELGLHWVPPSPNMPTPDTTLVYVGTGLFEGTNVCEGRGTTRPFELVGAPFLDYHWADRLAAYELPGVAFREAHFTPTFDRHRGDACVGVQVHVTDPRRFRPISTAVTMLVEAARYPDFAWVERAGRWPVDRLFGSPRLRAMIDAGAPANEIIDSWADEARAFDRRRQPYLLYPREPALAT